MTFLIEDKVAIVLGAGASKEFGLPTGKELSEQIVDLLRVVKDPGYHHFYDPDVEQAVRVAIHGGLISNRSEVIRSAGLICKSLCIAPSIDNFLHAHRENSDLVWLGKLAIVLSLLRAERSSILAIDPSNKRYEVALERAASTWIGQLFTQLAVAGDFRAFLERLQKIYFISFNYDRCVQQFFYSAARQYFALSDNEVRDLRDCLNIHYIYGSVGDFTRGPGSHSSFGECPTTEHCMTIVDHIRTFTEGRDIDDSGVIADYMDRAKEIYFLGFGFNKMNLQRILPNSGFSADRVYATTKGLPDLAASQIKAELEQLLRINLVNAAGQKVYIDHASVAFRDVFCRDLIWECQRNFQTKPTLS